MIDHDDLRTVHQAAISDQAADPWDELEAELFELGATAYEGFTFRNKDGVVHWPNARIDTVPMEYAPWAGEEGETRCDHALVGFAERRGVWPPKTIVISPAAKDLHHLELTPEAALQLSDVLRLYAEHLFKIRGGA
jgi:hypothetical protein